MSDGEENLPSLEKLDQLFGALDREKRDQLLEEILTAAPHGGEAIMKVFEVWLLDREAKDFIDGLPE